MNGITRKLAYVAIALAAVSTISPAQSVGERMRQRAQEKVESGVDKAIEKALAKLENTVNCLATDADCIAQAKQEKKEVKTFKTDAELEKANEKQQADIEKAKADVEKANTDAEAKPSGGSAAIWTNFDFVPGERVLFSDDLSKDRVGNFPQRMQFVEGNAQVVESKGKRWMQASSSPTVVSITLPEVLPRRFTIEFDLTLPPGFPTKIGVLRTDDADPNVDSPNSYAFFGVNLSGLIGGGVKAETPTRIDGASNEALTGIAARARIQVDGEYVKVYLNESRVANVPTAKFGRANKLFLQLWGSADDPVMIGNFTVAAGGRGLYDALMSDGRVATQGIFFDTGSDRIRAESGPTLKQIGDMLKDHADLKLLIEGHTDNVGVAASNLALSDKRAAAVKSYLVTTLGVAGARLTTKGFGDTKPATPNTTSEGRQQNRRVELVRVP